RHRIDQLAGERLVDRALHIQPVDTDTGLAGVAVFARDRSSHRRIQVGVLKYDEWGIAAELQRHLLHRLRALRHQLLADTGGTGEGELADDRIGGHLGADAAGTGSRDDVENPGWNAGTGGQLGHGQRGVRGLDRRFADERTTRGKCGARLARDHRRREIPRGNGGYHAYRLTQHQNAFVGLVT